MVMVLPLFKGEGGGSLANWYKSIRTVYRIIILRVCYFYRYTFSEITKSLTRDTASNDSLWPGHVGEETLRERFFG